MTTKVTLGPSGRLVIPKPVRDRLHLAPGDTLALESVGEEIVLRPIHATATMHKEKGMWVIKTGKKLTGADTLAMIDADREERYRQILGPWPE